MYIKQQQIIDIKCILGNTKKADLAEAIGINKSTLSREIKDKKILQQIDNFFESINPEINFLVKKLIDDEAPDNVLNEAGSFYKTKEIENKKLKQRIDDLLLIIETLKKLNASYEREINELRKSK